MAYTRAVRAGDTLGPQTQTHAIAKIQIQTIQAARVPHRYTHGNKLRIGVKLTDDVSQARHILRFHRIAGGVMLESVNLNFGLHCIQTSLASCQSSPGSLYMPEPYLLVSRFPPAWQRLCLFRLCVTTAQASPHRRKAQGCGGKAFVENCLHQYLSLSPPMIILPGSKSASIFSKNAFSPHHGHIHLCCRRSKGYTMRLRIHSPAPALLSDDQRMAQGAEVRRSYGFSGHETSVLYIIGSTRT